MAFKASKRQANFELLRIVAMLMVIILHYLGKGNILISYAECNTAINYFAWLLEAFCIVSTNCYVLISGYFLVESEWRPGRIVSLLSQILFYSVLIPVAMIVVGMLSWEDLGIYDWLIFFLPIEKEHYWFATAYLFMYLFAPVLAEGVKKMEQKTLKKVIIILLLFFSVGKTIFPVALVTDRNGYDYGWFLCLFLIAAYIRLYGIDWLDRRKHAIGIYIIMCVAIWGTSALAGIISIKTGLFSYYIAMPYTYNHILCLAGSIGLFYIFKNMKIKEGKIAAIIRKIAPYTFGVYLLHVHNLVKDEWMNWLQIDKVRGTWYFLPHMIVCVLVVYVVGTLVDFVRAWLFAKAGQVFVMKKVKEE